MARRPRIEYAGAVYHIINRGNYQQDLFTVGKSGEAFEKALFEAAERCGWVLHAYVIMSNHYHLLLETPEGNLVEGMRWLQGTFANRFNRFHGVRGQVFQGRYKSILVEGGEYFLGLANYIHLNPVRAGLVAVDNLRDYPLSSYPRYFKRNFPGVLCRDVFLAAAALPSTISGMKRYADQLRLVDEADPQKRDALYKKYQRGMIIGSAKFRKETFREFSKMEVRKDWGGKALRILNEEKWELLVSEALQELGKSEKNIQEDRKGAEWKGQIARILRRKTSATNPWISQRLNMGHPTCVSSLIHQKKKIKQWKNL